MARKALTLAVLALVVGSALGAGLTLTAVGPVAPSAPADTAPDGEPTGPEQRTDRTTDGTDGTDSLGTDGAGLGTFENESAFRAYVEQGNLLAGGNRLGSGGVRVQTARAEGDMTVAESADAGGDGGGSATAAPSRIANTNVQVGALDEPDIVKTDGRHFYYAPHDRLPGPRPVEGGLQEDVERAVERADAETHIVDASDPAAPEAVASIDTTGKLLQTGDRLVVFEHDRIAGYDVSDPAAPTEAWSSPLNGSLVTARERNGTIYVVTETPTGPDACPIEPLGGQPIACDDIHRPGTQIPVDATYSAFAIDAESGAVRDSVSFVGTSRNSVVYVSGDALYVTYTKPTDMASITAEFLRQEFDPTPDHLADRVAEIQSYDITPASKLREIQRALERWVGTLPAERQESIRESFHRQFQKYVADHQRELTRTGIVRVEASGGDLVVAETGTVPGRPLNQFSMDQHDGQLRIATTIPGVGSADSENDLYTLDSDSLAERGNVTGMGVTERVYSVRYVGDTAYVVTFRRVDPFHVVDLSDPENPEVLGELKLPGFSSYLHPVDDDHVLGVGEQNGKVKTVLFDVSDPSNPTIADSRVLDRGWSAVAETHHAFLMDRKHGVFVLPAGQRSVVMDYTGGSLDIETTVETDDPATRARYVEDSLYVFAGDSITVVDETTWQRTTTLELDE